MTLEELYLTRSVLVSAAALLTGFAVARAIKQQGMWDITAAAALVLLFAEQIGGR